MATWSKSSHPWPGDKRVEIGGSTISSRLFLGTARYPSLATLKQAVEASGSEIITVSLRRESAQQNSGTRFWDYLKDLSVHILPNTAGCTKVKEAVTTAHLSRELFGTSWIKLEVIGNEDTLQPDPFGTLEAARILIQDGFEVFPYTTDDLIVAERLIDAGCRIVMPWGSPIGTGLGIKNPEALRAIRRYFPHVTVVVDAGLGAPSHAAHAMELGADAVLINTAVARAANPVAMAKAFSDAVSAGRRAFESGLMESSSTAVASTPQLGIPFWQQNWI